MAIFEELEGYQGDLFKYGRDKAASEQTEQKRNIRAFIIVIELLAKHEKKEKILEAIPELWETMLKYDIRTDRFRKR